MARPPPPPPQLTPNLPRRPRPPFLQESPRKRCGIWHSNRISSEIYMLVAPLTPPKKIFRRPQAGVLGKPIKITLYDFPRKSHTGLFLPVLVKTPAAGRRKNFFERGFVKTFRDLGRVGSGRSKFASSLYMFYWITYIKIHPNNPV